MRFLRTDVSNLSSRFNLSSSSTNPAAWLPPACFFKIESEFVSGSVIVFKKFFPTAAFTIRRFSRAAALRMIPPIRMLPAITQPTTGTAAAAAVKPAIAVPPPATVVTNAVTLMLLVLALSAWMNNIVAAIVGFIYNGAAGVVVTLHQQLVSGNLGDNQVLHAGLNTLYWLVPHALVSSAPREIVRQEFEIFATNQPEGAASVDQMVSSIPGPSGAADIIWWVFVVCVMFGILYFAVRRRQV